MALALSGTSNGSLNNLSLSGNTATIVDTRKAGTIVQTQSMVRTQSTFSTTSTSFVDVTDFNLSITPTSSSNKILCFLDALVRTTGGFHANARSSLNLVRGSTVINTKFVGQYITEGVDGNNMYIPTQIIYLDSPATTSSTTYKIQVKSENSNFTTAIVPNDIPSITLMEVVA
jgi:hypothetical protein